MPRKLRIQYPAAMYHVMNRGDQREAVFHGNGVRTDACTLAPKAHQHIIPMKRVWLVKNRDVP